MLFTPASATLPTTVPVQVFFLRKASPYIVSEYIRNSLYKSSMTVFCPQKSPHCTGFLFSPAETVKKKPVFSVQVLGTAGNSRIFPSFIWKQHFLKSICTERYFPLRR